MIIDLIATISAGGAVAGLVLMLRWLSRGRLPRWLVPAGIGLGMLGFGVWNEYSWYPRTVGAMSDRLAILSAPVESSALRPWTYLAPVTHRFLALDRGTVLQAEDDAGLRRAEILEVARWQPVRRLGMVFDCTNARQALLPAADATPEGAPAWLPVSPEDPAQAAVCGDA